VGTFIMLIFVVSITIKPKTMSVLNELNETRLEMLNGCEVHSIKHEGCVGIKGDRVYRNGEEIETLNTNKKVSYLWRNYVKQEGL